MNKEQEKQAAVNSCVNCRFEETCGYSPLAMLGERTECSLTPCCLGMMSKTADGREIPFFQSREVAQ